jgi:vacuolar-type H+-ATPase subunit H
MGASSGKRTESSLAAAASERVRAIVEAAEQASTEIRARADEEASRIRSEAEERASRVRAEAEQHATGLRAQARTDVHALLDSIRSGMTRLSADLDQLDAKLTGSAAPTTPTADPPASAPTADTTAPAGSADEDAARLVALNMALNGKRRDEVEKHLSEHYDLSDQASLVDEVFASVEG